MIKKRVGFDLDGVLTLTDEAIMRDAQRRGLLLGRTPADIQHYFWEHAFPGEISSEVMAEILNAPGFYRGLRGCHYLLRALDLCRWAGYEAHVITARLGPEHVYHDTLWWLAQRRDEVPEVHICPAKEKIHRVRELGLRLFVEDRFDTANAVAACCPVLLVETPYNVPFVSEPYDLAPGVERVPREEVPLFVRGFLAADRGLHESVQVLQPGPLVGVTR